MKKRNGKLTLIFFLVIWVAFMSWVYIHEQNNKEEITFHVESSKTSYIRPYSNEELQQLAQEKNEHSYNTVVKNSVINSEQGPFEKIEDFIVEIEYPSNTQVYAEEVEIVEGPVVPTKPKSMFNYYSGPGFLGLYDAFEQNQKLRFADKYVYQVDDVDGYIKEKAEERGYQRRGFASESDLVSFENVRTLPEVKEAYVSMRNEMLEEGIRLHFVSGYRSSTAQRSIFTRKMDIHNPSELLSGIHNDTLDNVLSRSAVPGYSKHHSGYAADFGCGNNYLVYSFAETECYEWLSADNFHNAKRFGFIPSYPDDGGKQGPNPEPWEYVWVGSENI